MGEQMIITIKGKPGRYVDHGPNPDGSRTVFGPVIWNEKTGRWVQAQKGRYTTAWPADIQYQQLQLGASA